MRGEAHVTRIAYGIAELSRREGSALSISSQNARLKGDWIYVRQRCADSQGQLSHSVVMFSRSDYLYLHDESHLLDIYIPIYLYTCIPIYLYLLYTNTYIPIYLYTYI